MDHQALIDFAPRDDKSGLDHFDCRRLVISLPSLKKECERRDESGEGVVVSEAPYNKVFVGGDVMMKLPLADYDWSFKFCQELDIL